MFNKKLGGVMKISGFSWRRIVLALPFSVLVGCGGGGGSNGNNNGNPVGGNPTPTPEPTLTATPEPTPTATPVAQLGSGKLFPAIEGFSYLSGGEEGVTDSEGGFNYELGQAVVFSLGGIELGSVAGQELITLIDIVGAPAGDIRVQNIHRLLLALDSDGDNENGIQISNEVSAIADNFAQPDFSVEAFDAEVAMILSDVSTADSRVAELPSFADARSELELSLACIASGVFAGTFTGGDSGTFVLWVQHQRFDPGSFPATGTGTGVTSALVYSTVDDVVLGVAPREGISISSDKAVVSGDVSSGAEFTGSFDQTFESISGAWTNGLTSDSGVFTGERKAGAVTAVHRLAGLANSNDAPFTADGAALIGLDVMNDDSVSGILVTLRGDETALSGTLSNGVITVSGGEFNFTLDFDADGSNPANDEALGTVGGFLGAYTDNANGGTTIGTSCRLN